MLCLSLGGRLRTHLVLFRGIGGKVGMRGSILLIYSRGDVEGLELVDAFLPRRCLGKEPPRQGEIGVKNSWVIEG